MFDAVGNAKSAFKGAFSESERSAGWTEEVVRDMNDWIARCEQALSLSRHPPSSIVGSWGKWLLDLPGTAFDTGSSDWRKEQLLRMDISIHDVHELEDLYLRIVGLIDALERGLPEEELANGWSEDSSDIVNRSLQTLRQLIASGRRLENADSEQWRDTLLTSRVQWQSGGGQPWSPGDRLPRFWVDQPGSLCEALGRIVRLFDAVTWSDSWGESDIEE